MCACVQVCVCVCVCVCVRVRASERASGVVWRSHTPNVDYSSTQTNRVTPISIGCRPPYVGLDARVHAKEWFVNVSMRNTGMSVEVQPLTTAEFNAFV